MCATWHSAPRRHAEGGELGAEVVALSTRKKHRLHPHLPRGLDVGVEVVDEDALARLEASRSAARV